MSEIVALVQSLVDGHTDEGEERELLALLEAASPEELNDVLTSGVARPLMTSVDNRVFGPDLRSELIDLLAMAVFLLALWAILKESVPTGILGSLGLALIGIAALVAAACRRIERAEAPPVLDALARDAGLSPHQFHRLFKAITGLTPRLAA